MALLKFMQSKKLAGFDDLLSDLEGIYSENVVDKFDDFNLKATHVFDEDWVPQLEENIENLKKHKKEKIHEGFIAVRDFSNALTFVKKAVKIRDAQTVDVNNIKDIHYILKNMDNMQSYLNGFGGDNEDLIELFKDVENKLESLKDEIAKFDAPDLSVDNGDNFDESYLDNVDNFIVANEELTDDLVEADLVEKEEDKKVEVTLEETVKKPVEEDVKEKKKDASTNAYKKKIEDYKIRRETIEGITVQMIGISASKHIALEENPYYGFLAECIDEILKLGRYLVKEGKGENVNILEQRFKGGIDALKVDMKKLKDEASVDVSKLMQDIENIEIENMDEEKLSPAQALKNLDKEVAK